jgi:hypothetical protein
MRAEYVHTLQFPQSDVCLYMKGLLIFDGESVNKMNEINVRDKELNDLSKV